MNISTTTIVCDFYFESAHRLPHVDPRHKCFQLHGHNYRVQIHVKGPVEPHTGMVMDFADVKMAFAPIHKSLDHKYLNEIQGLENPTSEIIAAWIWRQLYPTLPLLSTIVVFETQNMHCIYEGPPIGE